MSVCQICHGLIMEQGKTYSYSGKICYCTLIKPVGQLGWICPRCSRSNSPFLMSCDCELTAAKVAADVEKLTQLRKEFDQRTRDKSPFEILKESK